MPGKTEKRQQKKPRVTSALTAPGRAALAAALLTFVAAAASGNNLLYLLFSTLAGALLLSLALGRLNLSSVEALPEPPDQAFRGEEFSLGIRLLSRSLLPRFGLRLSCRGQRPLAPRLDAGGEELLELRYLLPHRGRNRVEDLRLESDFPFGLLRHRRPLDAGDLTALPRTREVRSASELGGGVRVMTASAQRRSRSGDLWGVREMGPDEDIRYVNWKLSAKAGRLISVDYAEAVGSRVTVRLEGPLSGPAEEAAAEEAAGACRFFIDSGAEVRLLTPETGIDYGRGLLHLDRMLRALAVSGEGARPRGSSHPDPEPPPVSGDGRFWRRMVLGGAWLTYAALFLAEDFRVLPGFLMALPLLAGILYQEAGWFRLPSRFWDGATILVLLHAVFFHWRAAGIMTANTWLVAYMLVYFSMNPVDLAARRRALSVFFLGFFLASGQTISLWYVPAYLGFLAFFSAWLAAEWGADTRPGRGWPRVAGGLAVAAMVLGLAGFAAVPRFEPLGTRNKIVTSLGLHKLHARSSAVTGFTDSVTLGYFGEIRRSGARMMRIRPIPSPRGAPPPLYVRGMAFDIFDGRRWAKSAEPMRYRIRGRSFLSRDGSAPMPRSGKRYFMPRGREERPASAAEYLIYPMDIGVIFSAYPVVSIEGGRSEVFFDHTDSVRFSGGYPRGVRYVVNGSAGPRGEGVLDIAMDPDALLRRYLLVPEEGDARIKELALKVTEGFEVDLEKARAVEKYLRSSYGYSLFQKGGGLSEFLFETREGNCEYFASAGAILLRHSGVPARLVSGFLAEDFNEYGKFYDVRQSQAHAWVEAYARGRGWVRVDPTPPGSVMGAWSRGIAKKVMRWVEAGNVRWYSNVIGYDGYAQRNTFHRLGLAVSRLKLARVLGWLGAAVLLVLLLKAALSLRRRRERARAAEDLFSKAQSALEAAGLPREPYWTPKEYAEHVARKRPDLSGIVRLAEEHYLERYAGQERGPEKLAESRRVLAELRSRAGTRFGVLRRLTKG